MENSFCFEVINDSLGHTVGDEYLATVAQRLELEAELRHALAASGLGLAYQPKVDLRSGGVGGVEALVRWTHAERGEISPAEFIPMAEESGLVVPLGRWVLATALRAHAVRRAADPAWEPIVMWVNVSVSELGLELAPAVAAELAATGVPADRLGLEVVEAEVGYRAARPAG